VAGRRPKVLVAGVPRSSFDELAPVLDRHGLQIVQVTNADDSASFAFSERVDLVVLNAEPEAMTLIDVVRAIRSRRSASRRCSLLVMVEPGLEEEARSLIGHGVNRVMLSVDPPKFVAQQVADLLQIAPRTNLRLETRVLAELADGSEEVLGAVVNISVSGLLIESDADLEPGQHILVSMDINPSREPLSAVAEVVRFADPERYGIEGFGARFIEFRSDGRKRLEAILGDAFGVPTTEVQTIT
jgi:hypothetical protein